MLENFQDISELYKIIVFETSKTEDEVARSLGYTRSHFNRIRNTEQSDTVTAGVLDNMKKTYAKEIAQFVSRYSKTNSIAPEIDIEELAEHQRALLEIVLLMARDRKTVYKESLAVLKKRGLSGIVGGMGM